MVYGQVKCSTGVFQGDAHRAKSFASAKVLKIWHIHKYFLKKITLLFNICAFGPTKGRQSAAQKRAIVQKHKVQSVKMRKPAGIEPAHTEDRTDSNNTRAKHFNPPLIFR